MGEFLVTDCDIACQPPPPTMMMPPPPPPPWMERIPECGGEGECSNYPVISSINNVNNIFHMTSVIIVVSITSFILFFISLVILLRTKKKSCLATKPVKAILEEEHYKQKCYQNQYVDPKHKLIKIQALSNFKSESKELFENKCEAVSDTITKHTYETIDECYAYENSPPQSVIFTRGEVKTKDNKKFVDDSGYLFYNVTTLSPAGHGNIVVVNDQVSDRAQFQFNSFRKPNKQNNEYENC